MLYDRSYMKADPAGERPRALPWLLGVLAVMFAAELVLFSPWFRGGSRLLSQLMLTVDNLQHWRLWTLLTHGLMNFAGLNGFWSLMPVVFALAATLVMGRQLEPVLGPRRLVTVFVAACVMGGLLWSAVNWRHGGAAIGSYAGLCGLLAVYACIHPDERFQFLLFFFFPVTYTPRKVALAVLVVNLLALAFYEIPGGALSLFYSPAAQLGGLATGWLLHRLWRGNEQEMGWRQPVTELLRVPRLSALFSRDRKPSPPARRPAPDGQRGSAAAPAADALRAEVDRILDKISAQGFAALTPAERRTLDEAREHLARR